jgi:hypothetical protein
MSSPQSVESAVVFSFPIDRRVSLVRETARALFERNGEDANLYWRETARSLFMELVDQGRDGPAARREVLRFFEAVQEEFRRQLPCETSSASA